MKKEKKKFWTKKRVNEFNYITGFVSDITYILLFLVTAFATFQATYIFITQWHNIDLDYNLGLIVNDVNKINYRKANCSFTMLDYRSISDRGSMTFSDNLDDWYIKSSNRLQNIWLVSIPIVFISGFAFHYLFNRLLEKFK